MEGQGQLPEGKKVTDKQIVLIEKLVKEKAVTKPEDLPVPVQPYLKKRLEELTVSEGSAFIKALKELPELPAPVVVTKSAKAIPIPALGKTVAQLGLVTGIDYYERGGKFRLLKEGLQKVAASSTRRVQTEIKELKCEPSRCSPREIYLKMRGWVTDDEGRTIWSTEEQNNWSYELEMERTILKKLNERGSSQNKIMVNDVEMKDGHLQLKPGKEIELRSFMIDQQKYALRKVVGEVKRRLWGEWLGVTTVTKSELEQELVEARAIDDEEE